MNSLLIENQLFPVISYFKILVNCPDLIIEVCENYQKMSFRNRYVIFGANGVINLSIPIKGGRQQKQKFYEVEIDYSENWQVKHWRGLTSSYSNSPYFDYYAEALKSIIFSNEKYLKDYNLKALKWILKVLKINIKISFTSEYKKEYENILDCRNTILPKNFQHITNNVEPKYTQVFQDRLGFQPNLSILDLLFATGPDAIRLLKSVK